MWTLPYSTPQKAAVIFYGLLIGISMVPLTAVACLLLGAVLLLFLPTNRDAGGAFFLAQLSIWGLYLGIPVGAYVCWRVCRARLSENKIEESS